MNIENWYPIIKENCKPVYEKSKQYIKSSSNVFDIGSNIGAFIDFIINDFPEINIHLFEIVPAFIDYSKQKYKNNKNIHIMPYGLGEKEEVVSIYRDSVNFGYNFITTKETGIRGTINTFDNYIAKNQQLIDNISLIKIDVEEFEGFVLRGMKTLEHFKNKPTIICEIGNIKTHPFKDIVNEGIDFLYSLNYKPVVLKQVTEDYLFIPS